MAKVRITGAPNRTLPAVPRSQATIEAEGGETIAGDLNNDGFMEHMNITGDSHAAGGVPVKASPGAFVFSDTKELRINDPAILHYFGMPAPKGKNKKGFTPAHIAKKYDLNKFTDVLKNDDGSDPIRQRTAEQMLESFSTKLAELAMIQEGMKDFPNGIPEIAQFLTEQPEAGESAPMGSAKQSFQMGGDTTMVPPMPVDMSVLDLAAPDSRFASRDSAATAPLLPPAQPQSNFQFIKDTEFFIGGKKFKVARVEDNQVFLADGRGKPTTYYGHEAIPKKYFDNLNTGKSFSFNRHEPYAGESFRGATYNKVMSGFIGTSPQPETSDLRAVINNVNGPGRAMGRGDRFTIANESYEVLDPLLTQNGTDRYIRVKNMAGGEEYIKPSKISSAAAKNEFRFDRSGSESIAGLAAKAGRKLKGVPQIAVVDHPEHGKTIQIAAPAQPAPKQPAKAASQTAPASRTPAQAGVKSATQLPAEKAPPVAKRGDSLFGDFEEGGEVPEYRNGGGVVFLRNPGDRKLVRKEVMATLERAAQDLGIEIGISTAVTGHSKKTTSGNISRHGNGSAVDIASINGVSYASNPEAWSRQAEILSRYLSKAGAARNSERGNAQAVLYGFNDRSKGGNHLNHIHYSNKGVQPHFEGDGHDHGEPAPVAAAAAPIMPTPTLAQVAGQTALMMPKNVDPAEYFARLELGGEAPSVQADGGVADDRFVLPATRDGVWGALSWEDGNRIEMLGGKAVRYGPDGKVLGTMDGLYNPYGQVYDVLQTASQNPAYELQYPSKATVNLFGAFGRQHRSGEGQYMPTSTSRLNYNFDWGEFGKRHSFVEREYTGGQKAFQRDLADPSKHTTTAGWFQDQYNDKFVAATGKKYFDGPGPYGRDGKFGSVTFLAPGFNQRETLPESTPSTTITTAAAQAVAGTPRTPLKEEPKVGDYNPNPEREPAPNKWWTQDELALAGAVSDQYGVKRYGPTLQEVPFDIPDMVPMDASRAIAAVQGSYAGVQEDTSGMPPAVARALQLAASGQIADKVASTVAEYDNANVQAANQNDVQATQIRNQNEVQSAALRKEYLDSNAIADQAYDNANRSARTRSLKGVINGMTNAQQTNQLLPEIFPLFRIDPRDGTVHRTEHTPNADTGAGGGDSYTALWEQTGKYSSDPDTRAKLFATMLGSLSGRNNAGKPTAEALQSFFPVYDLD